MRIAVVGAGLAGLGVTYFLIKKGHQVTIFDKKGVGAGASGIPVGLCHPYLGRNGKPSKDAEAAIKATEELIDVAEKSSGKKLADRSGIFRADWTPYEWYSDLEKVAGGVLIKSGMTVFLKEYVHALYESFNNVELVQKQVSIKENLQDFDRIIFAAGSGMNEFDLPITFVKGQVLIGTSTRSLEKSEMKAKGHISSLRKGKIQLGSTYEHHFFSEEPDKEIAKKDLSEKLCAFFPKTSDFTIEECKSGVRACVKGSYVPIVQKISDQLFLFTGLGSRGLLYHAYYGRHLADMVE